MSRRLKYVMFSDAWWDEKRGRHRGRPRPLAATHFTWPRHCGCWNCVWIPVIYDGAPYSLFDYHPIRTVAPR